jgi:hypothetical protein
MLSSFMLDLSLFISYIFIANYLINYLNLKQFTYKVLMVMLTTSLISGLFMFLFLNFGNSKLFFYR